MTKKICDCGSKGKPQPPYFVRFRWVNDEGIEVQKKLSDPHWTTQSAAQRGYEEWIRNHPTNKKIETKSLDFLPLYEEYKRNLAATVKESSYIAITQRLDNFVLPVFKNKRVTEITAADILKWQADLTNKCYSYKYKTAVRSAFYHFFAYLKIYGIDNPIQKVKGFKDNTEQKEEIKFWTEDEFNKFIEVVNDPTYYALFSFLYLTGCRKGEALALKWSDFDLEKGTVRINKTLSQRTIDGTYKITSPKTKNSNRTILLPEKLNKILSEYRKDASTADFAFGGKSYLPFNSVTNYFKRYIQKSGVPEIRVHDLRHSHASLLINKGENQLSTIYVIAARLGDTVDMIFKTYGHMFPNSQLELLDKLSGNA